MKKKTGLVYFSLSKKHFCVPLDIDRYKDLTTGDEFSEKNDDAIRPVMPEDLLDSTIVVEINGDKSHYIRVSYLEVNKTHKVNDNISVEVDNIGRLIGIKLDYPFPTK